MPLSVRPQIVYKPEGSEDKYWVRGDKGRSLVMAGYYEKLWKGFIHTYELTYNYKNRSITQQRAGFEWNLSDECKL